MWSKTAVSVALVPGTTRLSGSLPRSPTNDNAPIDTAGAMAALKLLQAAEIKGCTEEAIGAGGASTGFPEEKAMTAFAQLRTFATSICLGS